MQIVSIADNLHKCQILFSRKNKKTVTNLSSAASADSMVSVKYEDIVPFLTIDET